MPPTSHSAQGTVLSIGIRAILLETIRLTATGGVNWPTATISVSTTPSHTRSQPKAMATGWISGTRSEEHTSELQSRENLVCRLLLEKKKKKKKRKQTQFKKHNKT